MLLLRGAPHDVRAWAAKGVVPVAVGRYPGWTVLVPRGVSPAAPPYDDALPLLAARRVRGRLGPGLGFWEIDGRAVLTVHHGRGGPRWVVWETGVGVVRPPGLPVAGPDLLLRIAGDGSRSELVEILAEDQLPPRRLLAAVAALLGLPGARVLVRPEEVEGADDLRDVTPPPRQVEWFDDAVRDAVLLRRELEHER